MKTAKTNGADEFVSQVYASFNGCNRTHSIRICRTHEFSSPETLEVIKFPEGANSYDDLSDSFIEMAKNRANELSQAGAA